MGSKILSIYKRGKSLYHLHVRSVRKALGESCAESSAYMTRSGRYSSRGDAVRHVFQMGMPNWVVKGDLTCYWKLADSMFSRSNARNGYLIDFALPRNLPRKLQTRLARKFARAVGEISVEPDNGFFLPMLLVIHEGYGCNPHAHLLISTSICDEWTRSPESWFKRYNAKSPDRGGARRSPIIGRKEWLLSVRELWGQLGNAVLCRMKLPATLDHRPLVPRQQCTLPTLHLGPSAAHLLAQDRPAPRVLRYREQLRIRSEIQSLERQVQCAREQLLQTQNALYEWYQYIKRWQHLWERHFQTLLVDHPLESSFQSILEHASILVVDRAGSVKSSLSTAFANVEPRRPLIDLAGPEWHAMLGPGAMYFLRPHRNDVVAVGPGYLATDAHDESAVQLMCQISLLTELERPLLFSAPNQMEKLKTFISKIGKDWPVLELNETTRSRFRLKTHLLPAP